jgi:mersacidin/lichenicidin family type 2 lantibiotic
MNRFDIVRAWKDAAFRNSLSAAQQAALPSHPAGLVELTDLEASAIEGKAAFADCGSCHSHKPSCDGMTAAKLV